MYRVVLSLALISTAMMAAAFEIPQNDGFVTDARGVLTQAQDQELEVLLSQYRKDTSNEIAVVVIGSLSGSSVIDTAVEIGRKWRVGTEEDDNGVLMLIAYDDREVAIITGYGLEGAVPDIVAQGIIDEEILPQFRKGSYYDGIFAGVMALQKHIGGEYEASRYDDWDGGGFFGFLLFILFIGLDFLAAIFGRTKSWWLGGVVGGIFGLVLTSFYGWWMTIPLLTGIGLLFDYIVSRHSPNKRSGRGGGIWPGGTSGRSGGGGFGGFGGGSFGGGGARGRW